MATEYVPYRDAGQASFEILDDYLASFLVSGSQVPLKSYPFEMAVSTTLAQWEVVGLNSSGKLAKATFNADPEVAIKPIGIVTQAVVSGASGVTSVPVFFQGVLNPAALVWHSTFDTDAKKMAAFNGSPTPTQILLRKRGSDPS
jgi:hypothetical protein